ncbi:MAG: dockerin type I domain-containing protein, partial [Planctomycetota bacterium]
ASSTPANAIASYITIENLEIRSGRPPYQFTDDNGNSSSYSSNAASIFVELGQHITIRNCTIHDSGNGIFVADNNGQTRDILIANNYLFDNGISGSIFHHNSYTEAIGVTFEFNRFGPLRADAPGNNLKDRSAGLVVRYNWIEGGNRQLDLVESDSNTLFSDPSYRTTYAYGNILIEPDGEGNRQFIHYGGDNGNTSIYRKGDFYFFNNTVISTRGDRTTLARVSTADETMHAFNNVIYCTASGSELSLLDDDGILDLQNNWIKDGWVESHAGSGFAGVINDLGNNLTGADPSFADFGGQDFTLLESSTLVDSAIAVTLPGHDLLFEYVLHRDGVAKNIVGSLDIGAFEYQAGNFELGDVNQDGSVNLLDVAPFVELLSAGTYQAEADCNQDGSVNLLDVDPFVAILGSG